MARFAGRGEGSQLEGCENSENEWEAFSGYSLLGKRGRQFSVFSLNRANLPQKMTDSIFATFAAILNDAAPEL